MDASVVIDVSYWRDLLNACADPDRLYFYEEGKNLFCCGDASNKGHGFTIFQLSREDLQFNDETPDVDGTPLQKHLLISINSGSFNKEQTKWSKLIKNVIPFIKNG